MLKWCLNSLKKCPKFRNTARKLLKILKHSLWDFQVCSPFCQRIGLKLPYVVCTESDKWTEKWSGPKNAGKKYFIGRYVDLADSTGLNNIDSGSFQSDKQLKQNSPVSSGSNRNLVLRRLNYDENRKNAAQNTKVFKLRLKSKKSAYKSEIVLQNRKSAYGSVNTKKICFGRRTKLSRIWKFCRKLGDLGNFWETLSNEVKVSGSLRISGECLQNIRHNTPDFWEDFYLHTVLLKRWFVSAVIPRSAQKKVHSTIGTGLVSPREGGGGTWVKFYSVFAAGTSEPLPHYSQFLIDFVAKCRPHLSHFWAL